MGAEHAPIIHRWVVITQNGGKENCSLVLSPWHLPSARKASLKTIPQTGPSWFSWMFVYLRVSRSFNKNSLQLFSTCGSFKV
jgi:hypothetical protein